MTAIAADVVYVQADAAGVFGYDSALFERVENAIDAVVLHGEQETTRQLGSVRAGVEQSRCGVYEPFLRHEVVRFDGSVDVITVYAHRYSHQHVLWPFDRATV